MFAICHSSCGMTFNNLPNLSLVIVCESQGIPHNSLNNGMLQVIDHAPVFLKSTQPANLALR